MLNGSDRRQKDHNFIILRIFIFKATAKTENEPLNHLNHFRTMIICNEIFIVYVTSTNLLFFFVLYPYFAIVRSTRFPRSALRCLPSSLFAAELITNDKFVEISSLTCLVFVEAVSAPITWWNDNYWRPKTFGRYDICTTSDLWNGNHSTRSELDFSSIQQNSIVYHFL